MTAFEQEKRQVEGHSISSKLFLSSSTEFCEANEMLVLALELGIWPRKIHADLLIESAPSIFDFVNPNIVDGSESSFLGVFCQNDNRTTKQKIRRG